MLMNMNKTNVSIGRNRQNYDCRARKSIKITNFSTHIRIYKHKQTGTYASIGIGRAKARERVTYWIGWKIGGCSCHLKTHGNALFPIKYTQAHQKRRLYSVHRRIKNQMQWGERLIYCMDCMIVDVYK